MTIFARYFRTKPLEKTYPAIWVDALFAAELKHHLACPNEGCHSEDGMGTRKYRNRMKTMETPIIVGAAQYTQGKKTIPALDPLLNIRRTAHGNQRRDSGEILKEYKTPEDLIVKDGILKELTKRLV